MRRPGADAAVTGALTLIVLGPLLVGGGFWLIGDMVFVPHQPWKAAWLGMDDALPRAVPMDAVVWLLNQAVPGSAVQRLFLVGGFLAGGLGIAALVRRLGGGRLWYARAAAITLYCWNPWVYERLLIGQWAILLGYFLLPWVAWAALRLRTDPRDWAPAAVALTLSAVCGPSSGVMAVAVLAVLALGRDLRRWLTVGLLGVAANLPWAVPALTAGARVSTEGVFAGFAARAESAAGTAASLLSLGGIWKTSIVPPERASALVVVLAGGLSVGALLGLRRLEHGRWRWWLVGAAAFAVALLPTVGGGASMLSDIGDRIHGLVLLRDSHRYLAPFALVVAVGIAYAAEEVRQWVRAGRSAWWGAVALVVVAPVLLLPSLAWGALGDLDRSSYPPSWDDVAAQIGDHDTTVVLPWAGAYRGYDWNHHRAVLDPAPRYLPGEVLVDDRLFLTDRTVPAEDPRVMAVGKALTADDPAAALRALGVRWVLIERGMGPVVVPEGTVAVDRGGLTLIDLAGHGRIAPDSGENPAARRILIGIGNTLATSLLFAGCAVILLSNARHVQAGSGRNT